MKIFNFWPDKILHKVVPMFKLVIVISELCVNEHEWKTSHLRREAVLFILKIDHHFLLPSSTTMSTAGMPLEANIKVYKYMGFNHRINYPTDTFKKTTVEVKWSCSTSQCQSNIFSKFFAIFGDYMTLKKILLKFSPTTI